VATLVGFAANVPPPGDSSHTIPSGGIPRHFILHIPVQYDGRKPLPLVFILHGLRGSASQMLQSTGMNAKADTEGFFVAYLDGTLCDTSLNSPACDVPKQGFNSGLLPELGIETDDVRFVRDVLREVQELARVDVRRIHAAGFSNGGAMTHRLGAELADLLAGIAIVEGIIGRVNPNPPPDFLTVSEPVGPIPVAIVHGRNDATYPFNGGGPSGALPVGDAVAFWVSANQCVGPIIEQIVSSPDLEITRCEQNVRRSRCTPLCPICARRAARST
jgi:polyhydroxybutyrate depolymerase